MTVRIILWVYVALLLGGGLAGYMLRKSQVSLITSLLFAAGLSYCAWTEPGSNLSLGLLAALLLVFAIRLLKTRKWMPSGLLVIITGLVLVCVVIL